MACCALAAFVVSQLLLGADWLRERLGFAAALAVPSASAAWRLGDAPLPRARALTPRRVALSFAAGACAFALAYVALGVGGEHGRHAVQIPYLCSSAPSLASE
jgi:hypothetical protein